MPTIHFLLVDDEKSFVETLALRLQERGFEVECAFSGEEAMERLKGDQSIDVVVLDRKMPGLDGVQAMKMIKKAQPLVEVILLTGYSDIASAVDAVRHGAFDYLEKPCEIDQLLSKAHQAYSRKVEREVKIRDVRMKPYLSPKERDVLIAKILKN